MTDVRLIGAELRQLSSTYMPLAFLIVLAVIAVINASAVIWGTGAPSLDSSEQRSP